MFIYKVWSTLRQTLPLTSWPSVIALGCPYSTSLSCFCVHCRSLADKNLHLTFRAAGITIITSSPYVYTVGNPALLGEGSIFL